MRIAIDAVPLLLRSAGVKTYLYHWIQRLRRLAGEENILAFPWIGALGEYSHEKSIAGRPGTFARLLWLHGVNYCHLPVLDWVPSRVDIFHASHQLRNPPRRSRLTTTLYDMTCWLLPETHSPANVRALRRFWDCVARRADGLIAISENTREDAVRILDLPRERIQVIYPGVADAFFHVEAEQAWEVRQQYGLASPYVLYVGTIEPRKNIDTLLDAWGQLKSSLREEFELVLAGPMGWAAPATARRVHAGAPGVRYLGYVPEEDLPAVTAGAVLFAYPSLYEGFGLPLAQAMAAGVAVIASDVSSIPEVVGEGGILVDPRSPSELAGAIERLLLDPERRAELGGLGTRRARCHFTWGRCARESLEFFERVCGT